MEVDILGYKLLESDPFYRKDRKPKGKLKVREAKWQVLWRYTKVIMLFTKKKYVWYVEYCDAINKEVENATNNKRKDI